MLGADRAGTIHQEVDRVVGRLEAKHEEGVGAVAGHREARLGGVDQATVARLETRLGELAHAFGAALEAGEANAGRGTMGGTGLHPHPGLSYDAESSLGADEQPIGAGSGTRSGQASRRPDAGGGEGVHRLDEVLDVGPDGGEVTGGSCGDPATEGGKLEGLGEVAQSEAVLGQLGLQGRSGGACLDQGGA